MSSSSAGPRDQPPDCLPETTLAINQFPAPLLDDPGERLENEALREMIASWRQGAPS